MWNLRRFVYSLVEQARAERGYAESVHGIVRREAVRVRVNKVEPVVDRQASVDHAHDVPQRRSTREEHCACSVACVQSILNGRRLWLAAPALPVRVVVGEEDVIVLPIGVLDAFPRQDRAGVGLERNDGPSEHVEHGPRPEVRDPDATLTFHRVPDAKPHCGDGLRGVPPLDRRVLRSGRHDDVVVLVPDERFDGCLEPRSVGFDRQRDDDDEG